MGSSIPSVTPALITQSDMSRFIVGKFQDLKFITQLKASSDGTNDYPRSRQFVLFIKPGGVYHVGVGRSYKEFTKGTIAGNWYKVSVNVVIFKHYYDILLGIH